jgi:hypothetical protein
MESSGSIARVFTSTDQAAFAELSGDYNPIHVDPIQARRFIFGDIAVHGLHTLLWALDCLCAEQVELVSLRAIRAFFDAPVTLYTPLSFTYEQAKDGVFKVRLRKGRVTVLRLSVEPGSAVAAPWNGETSTPKVECANPAPDEISGMFGSEPLTLPLRWKEMFPTLGSRFSPSQVAVLLATTRLIGMICPGLHSVFSSLKMLFADETDLERELSYGVKRFDNRVRLLDIEVRCGGAQGVIQAFQRPSPVEQPGFVEISSCVETGEFSERRALVIGGSRGLGELTGKLLAAGGAKVTLTYARGVEDAARIVEEGDRHRLQIKMAKFDVMTPGADRLAQPPTHLYYFATPRIPVGEVGVFDVSRFAPLIDHYVVGLARTVTWLAEQLDGSRCIVWVPSTAFLEEDGNEFAEYVAAKACAEALCKHLDKSWPNITIQYPRLPRLPSDQTQSLLSLEMQNAGDVILAALRDQ